MKPNPGKHETPYPSVRGIRRACRTELYRTVKRLRHWVSPDMQRQAEELYVKQVVLHLPFIVENRSNRKALADWWDDHVASDIAALWEIDRQRLSDAFRSAFGG